MYLQVDWDGPLDPHTSKGISAQDEQQLRVVARFRTKDHGGFSVGQDVPSTLITGSLQDASDPEMEWISATVIASANRVGCQFTFIVCRPEAHVLCYGL